MRIGPSPGDDERALRCPNGRAKNPCRASPRSARATCSRSLRLSRALDFAVLGIRRHLRLLGADHDEHPRVLVGVVAKSAVPAGRNRDGIARREDALARLAVLLHEERDLAVEDEEHLLGVRVEVQRPLGAGREQHRAEREVLGGNDRRIAFVIARGARADVADLRTPVLVVDCRLESRACPSPRRDRRDARYGYRTVRPVKACPPPPKLA